MVTVTDNILKGNLEPNSRQLLAVYWSHLPQHVLLLLFFDSIKLLDISAETCEIQKASNRLVLDPGCWSHFSGHEECFC